MTHSLPFGRAVPSKPLNSPFHQSNQPSRKAHFLVHSNHHTIKTQNAPLEPAEGRLLPTPALQRFLLQSPKVSVPQHGMFQYIPIASCHTVGPKRSLAEASSHPPFTYIDEMILEPPPLQVKWPISQTFITRCSSQLPTFIYNPVYTHVGMISLSAQQHYNYFTACSPL